MTRTQHSCIPRLGWAFCALLVVGCGPLLGLDQDARLIEGAGGDTGCVVDADCGDDNPCSIDSCLGDGRCEHRVVGNGVAPAQVEGDCLRTTCVDGEAQSLVDDDDTPAASDCDNPYCEAGAIVAQPVARGAACDDGQGALCDGQGSCVECLDDEGCELPETCGGAGIALSCGCTPLSCFELGVSCGLVSDTCSGVLDCNDSVANGDETDIDCGGTRSSCFARCNLGQRCEHGQDCASALCAGGSCGNPWSEGFGAPGQQTVQGVAVGPDGSIVVVGNYSGTIDFGGGPLPSAAQAMFVAKIDAFGAHVFSHDYVSGTPGDVAIDSSGNIVLVGKFDGSLDFGGGPMTSTL
jgi:hypothetical protein